MVLIGGICTVALVLAALPPITDEQLAQAAPPAGRTFELIAAAFAVATALVVLLAM